jgi:uncharacterized protein (DUF1778 family)
MNQAAKTARRNIRVSPSDDRLFRDAAAALGESVTEFLVESARERAEMVLADRARFALDDDAWDAFTTALERPVQENAAVVALMRRPRPE